MQTPKRIKHSTNQVPIAKFPTSFLQPPPEKSREAEKFSRRNERSRSKKIGTHILSSFGQCFSGCGEVDSDPTALARARLGSSLVGGEEPTFRSNEPTKSSSLNELQTAGSERLLELLGRILQACEELQKLIGDLAMLQVRWRALAGWSPSLLGWKPSLNG